MEETKKTNWLMPTVVIVILVGGVFFTTKQNSNQVIQPTNIPVATELTEVKDATEISVEGGMFYFKPNVIQAKKGEVIKITFTNKEGFHDFVLDKFNVKSKVINAGESETIEFTPDELGEFEFYCSVGDHKQKGMVGKLIVGN